MKWISSYLVVTGVLLWPGPNVWAHCRTTTCDQEGAPAECASGRINNCSTTGVPIAWPSTCVSTSVSAYGSALRGISADTLRTMVESAFKQWTSADCGGGSPPSFAVDIFPDVTCKDLTGDAGYKSAGPNANVWLFEDDNWPHLETDAEAAIAVTSVLFDKYTGEIYDADVELNSFGTNFTTDTDVGNIDLESVVQHESGHFLGLAHSQDTEATMYATLDPKAGETKKRTLNRDDVEGICAIYPPGKYDALCDPEPRHGFSTACDFQRTSCTVASRLGANRPAAGRGLLIALLFIGGIGRRRTQSVANSSRGLPRLCPQPPAWRTSDRGDSSAAEASLTRTT